MNKIRVSQSLIKDWWEYKDEKQCGLVFRAVWIDRTLETPASDVMLMGNYFEYLCTGATMRDGKVPEPVLTKAGKPVAKQQYLMDQVQLWKTAVKHYGIQEIRVNEKLEVDCGDYILVVRPDIICKFPGYGETILDIKSTGLLNSMSYNEYSWNKEYLASKHKLTVQAKMTKLVCQGAMGHDDIPFLWFIFSNTGDEDAAFYEAVVDSSQIAKLVEVIEEAVSLIEIEIELGFTPHPDYSRCKDCPLNEGCTAKDIVPDIIRIHTT